MKLHCLDFDWITPNIAVVIVDPSSAQHWRALFSCRLGTYLARLMRPLLRSRSKAHVSDLNVANVLQSLSLSLLRSVLLQS